MITGLVWIVDGSIEENSPLLIDLGNNRKSSQFQLSATLNRNGSLISCVVTVGSMNLRSNATLLIQGNHIILIIIINFIVTLIKT